MSFKYKGLIKFNQDFNKSTNILYDKENCNNYILTTSAINTLRVLFDKASNNSLSIIGPFGCGKSSLLLYVDTLLSDTKYSKKCEKKLSLENPKLHRQFYEYKKNKNFFKIKIVGEYISFKTQFKNVILGFKELKQTIALLKHEEYQLSKALYVMSGEIEELGYTDIMLSIDEFGKFIEFSLEDNSPSDIFELQTISEFVNKRNNWKLIISLHKTFKEYTLIDYSLMTYTEWDKIQGRFENIVFRDDYYEMLNVFKEAIVSDEKSIYIKEARKHIAKICKDKAFSEQINNQKILSLFSSICPLHPYSALIIAELFTKYFQNQRSIYSFLFSSEANSFQEFIDKEFEKYELYLLADLYNYVRYLLKIYNILLPDEELWYLSERRLKDNKIKNEIQKDIVKTIALLNAFKLNYTILPDKRHLLLSLVSRYTQNQIAENLNELEKNNILVFQEQSQAYSLLENSNIDINKEIKKLLSQNTNFDYEKNINELMLNKRVLARRFFLTYGLEKYFEKVYILDDTDKIKEPYKIFLIAEEKKDFLHEIMTKNLKSIFVFIKNHNKLKSLSKRIIILKHIQEENREKTSIETQNIIDEMIFDSTKSFEDNLKRNIEKSYIYFGNKKYKYDHKVSQNIMSNVMEVSFKHTPKINNYTLNHNRGKNTSIVKLLFEAMLEKHSEKDLGIEKMPAQKALYLSVIKPSGIHQKVKNSYILSEPTSEDFQQIWKSIKDFLNNKVSLDSLVKHLSQEPFGLEESKALFVISLFIIVHKDFINIFQDNTYKYDVNVDLIINMWKASKKYKLQFINLSKNELKLFEAYMKIISDISDLAYSKVKVTAMTKVLFTKINMLSDFAQTTQNISKKAIALRSTLFSMKEPTQAYFEDIPKALGYKSIQNMDIDKYILDFKTAFNEIALSYKKIIVDLEKFISQKFVLSSSSFPYNNELVKYANKLSSIDGLEKNINAMTRAFVQSNSLIELINSLAITLIKKEIERCSDRDLGELKSMLEKYSKEILGKLELIDIAKNRKNIRKVSLESFAEGFNKIITVDDKKIGTITKEAENMKKLIPSSYTADEKIYLISQLLKEELENE